MAPRYEQLRAWQLAHQTTLVVFRLSEDWPKREWYGLAAQLRKSLVSVGSNLVEGSAKRGVREYRRFVDIAIGSYNEAEYQYRLAKDLGYVNAEQYGSVHAALDELGKLAKSLDR